MNVQPVRVEDHAPLQTTANVMLAGLVLIVLFQPVSTLARHLRLFVLDTVNVLPKTSVSVIQVTLAQNVKFQSAIIGQPMILLFARLTEIVLLQIIVFARKATTVMTVQVEILPTILTAMVLRASILKYVLVMVCVSIVTFVTVSKDSLEVNVKM